MFGVKNLSLILNEHMPKKILDTAMNDLYIMVKCS
jgi:hypothetical protein